MAEDSTLDVGDSRAGASGAEEEAPALLIAWAAFEPERVGEVALFEPGGGALILGRGEATGGERVSFYRQRPGRLERTAPLASPGISREQLRIRPEGDRLHVTQIGKCSLEIQGERVDRAVIGPGETLLLKGQMLLLCTRRPRQIPPQGSASLAAAPPFGAPDAHGIVGESPAAWRLREKIAWMANVDEHTLILGGSGSGKELCARALHGLSTRARGPFIARNAATIPPGILDAELFGNVKGYPNPGMPERPGLIGAADGGTLFLDELGELPQAVQANLLRVLDEGGEYHSLGGSAAKRSRFRLLGATNRDPEALKHDLAARLVLRLDVPGLDERRDDIPLLARHLLRRAAAKSPEATRRFLAAEVGDLRVKASLLDHLLRVRYTTHIRELDALLWRAMATSSGNAIGWTDGAKGAGNGSARTSQAQTPHEGAATGPRPRDSSPGPIAPPPEEDAPREEADGGRVSSAPEPSEAEVRASLAAHGGNIVRTAQALGLSSRYVLYRLMRRYGIES